MTIKLHTMKTAMAVRDACQRQVDKSRPIDHLNIDTIERQARCGDLRLT